MLEFIVEVDRSLFHWINQKLHTSFLDSVMLFLTTISNLAIFWFVMALGLFFVRKKIGGALSSVTLFVGVSLALLVDEVLNAIVGRPRPPQVEEGVRQLVDLPLSSSFPSGHAVTSFAAMYILVYFFPKTKYWLPLLAILFAYSRLYVGVHYPLDSMAGALIGILVGMMTMKLPLNSLLSKLQKRFPSL
ncbi:phosphatase PAP2 family protein [Halalkalibacterium ligniniphilum]|uniref:phosphatase PAP2 family protein n=1 Tax=Halalkalibacterium ligniniphilum TaxID=1134413 RepID=UPI00036E7A03|nr:phosphatase PAP2 family protein [Halalkalibacterium ligniniphilum]